MESFFETMTPLVPFFAAVVGALVSLLGILVTLRWNQKIHENNLEEERRKRRESREFSAKQEALITAFETVNRFVIYYTSLADKVLPCDGTIDKEVAELSVSLNRLHFYCGIETIEKSTHLAQVLGNAFAEAMKAKMASAFMHEDLKVIDIQISSLEKWNSCLQEEIKAILQSGSQNPLLISARQQLAQNHGAISKLHAQRVDIIKQKYIETEKCRDVISRNLTSIYEALKDILLLARRELCFPVNEEQYKQIIDNQIKTNAEHLQNFLLEVRKQILEKMES